MGDVSGKQLQLFVPPQEACTTAYLWRPQDRCIDHLILCNSVHFGNWTGFSMFFFHPCSISGSLWKEGQGRRPESLGKLPLL